MSYVMLVLVESFMKTTLQFDDMAILHKAVEIFCGRAFQLASCTSSVGASQVQVQFVACFLKLHILRSSMLAQ